MSEVSTSRLQREWALCALAAAAARFVPVPLVDDLVRERAVRTAVARTWRAHGRPDAPGAVDVLCADTRGFWAGVASTAARLPLTLALYPVRKTVRMVTAVRGVGRDVAEVLLLARAVDRTLAAGWFDTADAKELERQARLVRAAHDRTVGTADLHVLEHGLRTALHRAGGLRSQAGAFAERVFGRDRDGAFDPAAEPGPDPAAEPGVEAGAREVQQVLHRPDVAGVLAELDRRFDAALGAATAAAD